jgi:hypothetical protein
MDILSQSTDLLNIGRQLIEFADTVYGEKNRATIINYFYEQLYQFTSIVYTSGDSLENEKSNYFICNEKYAVIMYVALNIPKKTSTVKSIIGIKSLGEFILSNYTKPAGKCISEESLKNILQHLEKEYLFTSKVFSNRKAIFIRLKNSHKEYNSECLTIEDKNGISNHFFLYHMKEKESLSPEAVLFHELGHALHARYCGSISKVPNDIIEKLNNLCFPDLKQLEPAEQCELFADVLGIGLMYQTPYEEIDLYKNIHINDKKEFKMLVEKIIKNL